MGARIYVVGRPSIATEAALRFLDMEVGLYTEWVQEDAREPTDAEDLCEVAGRVCYMAWGEKQGRKTNREYLGNIIESGHGSVLEHAVWNFIFAGISRSLSHELVRHRHMSYSMLSQRYVDESDVEFVMPEAIAALPESLRAKWLADVEEARDKYAFWAKALSQQLPDDLSARSRRIAARQAARSVLPNATETKIFATANARALRHFLVLRGSRHAEPEIRSLAHQLLGIMREEAPNIFGDLHIEEGEIRCAS